MTEPTELNPADLDRLEAQAAAADSSPNDMIVWEDTAWAYSVLAMVPDTVFTLVAGYRRMLALEGIADVARRSYDQSLASCARLAPEDAAVEVLGERIGYGAMMASASRLWHAIEPGGAFTVGSCYALLEIALEEPDAD